MSQNEPVEIEISNFLPQSFHQVLTFCDQHIGRGYFTLDDITRTYELSTINNLNCSLIAQDLDGNILGIRLTFAPGVWFSDIKCITPDRWKAPKEHTAYFKSLFLDPSIQGQGVGGQLSTQSINVLKQLGTKAIVCHSWKESPNNSSMRYLQKFGFVPVKEHPHFWGNVDYNCVLCKKPPCKCTAIEMIYYL